VFRRGEIAVEGEGSGQHAGTRADHLRQHVRGGGGAVQLAEAPECQRGCGIEVRARPRPERRVDECDGGAAHRQPHQRALHQGIADHLPQHEGRMLDQHRKPGGGAREAASRCHSRIACRKVNDKPGISRYSPFTIPAACERVVMRSSVDVLVTPSSSLVVAIGIPLR
jgi:hypothetical protein